MKKTAIIGGMFFFLFLSLAVFLTRPASSVALIHASVTGRVWTVNSYHGRVVRFTIRDNGWTNPLHDIVIRNTHIHPSGNMQAHLSPNVLHRGEMVRAQGGVTTFGNRIVADEIILLSR